MDKGQGLPITTIVIAALAILVLVILFAITTGRLSIFAGAVNECPGVCFVEASSPGASLAQPGALETVNSNPARNTTAVCIDQAPNYEKKVYGSYIARGVKTGDNKPIPCHTCCISTLS